MATVDVRLAGGHVSIDLHTLDYLSDEPFVKLSAPSGDLVMSADEARTLAAQILEAAREIDSLRAGERHA